MTTALPGRAALLLAAAVLAAGCGGVTRGKEDADRAVTEFHDRFNAGRYDAIWDAASEDFKRATSKEDLSALLAAVRRKLGDVTGTTSRGWNVRTQNLTTFVALQQETRYAKGDPGAPVTGTARESFQFVVKDGRATLLGYDVSGRDLVLR